MGTAVYMTEVGGRFARMVRTVVEAMTALPSIVAGLFIYTVLIIAAGRAALGARRRAGDRRDDAADHRPGLRRGAPGRARGACARRRLALGASRWRTVWHVVLPTARPGLATAVILGIARGIGETVAGAAHVRVRHVPGHEPDATA